MNVTWDYFAGFTDGEGYIGIISRGPRATWGQKDKHQLEVLRDFLISEGFHPTFYHRKQNPSGGINKTRYIWVLNMARRDEILRLCEILLPLVVLKVPQCMLVLQWLKDNPRRWHTAELERDLIRQYAEEGYTQPQIGKLVGCSAQKIAKAGKKLGIIFHKSGGKIENGKHVDGMSQEALRLHRQKKEKSSHCPDCGKFIYLDSARCPSCALKHRHRTRPESFRASNIKSVLDVTNLSAEPEKL